MSAKVLIATRSFGSTSDVPWNMLADNQYEVVQLDINKATDEELAQAMRDVSGLIIGSRAITRELLGLVRCPRASPTSLINTTT